ncbi:MAG TPA: chemotaxis protein CheW [Vicinamibacteria bacterium]|nr:chemotaxis protein CheW [Vicinamibacteria bacterium]
MQQANAGGGPGQYLGFHVGDQEYGVPILTIREILEYEPVTRVPSAPPSVRGVINLRGSVVAVVDLALKLGLAGTRATARTCIVIVEALLHGRPAVVGLLADAVSHVIELAPRDIEPPPSFGTRPRAEYLHGLGKVGRRFVLLLDIDRVLSAEDGYLAALAPDESETAEPAAQGRTAPPSPME